MKIKARFLTQCALLAFSCSVLALPVVRADDHGNDDTQGGEIEGVENGEIEVMMTPTSAAPLGASVRLEFESEDDHGASNAELKLETNNLLPATYSVTATRKSDGSIV